MSILAAFIVLLLNAGIVPAIHFEDEAIVSVMGEVAIDALIESRPECAVEGDPTWDFNADDSDGLSIIGRTGTCEYAGWFYRSPETGLWQFNVEGS